MIVYSAYSGRKGCDMMLGMAGGNSGPAAAQPEAPKNVAMFNPTAMVRPSQDTMAVGQHTPILQREQGRASRGQVEGKFEIRHQGEPCMCASAPRLPPNLQTNQQAPAPGGPPAPGMMAPPGPGGAPGMSTCDTMHPSRPNPVPSSDPFPSSPCAFL